jgi:hypothetical protein
MPGTVQKTPVVGAIALLLLLCPLAAAFAFTAQIGSAELDITLDQINLQAKADLGAYTAELSLSFNLQAKTITTMLNEVKMEPVEVYLTAELASLSKKPIDEVIKVYQANRGKGWGQIARQLGIKPGSEQFKQLKNRSTERLGKMKAKSKSGPKKP